MDFFVPQASYAINSSFLTKPSLNSTVLVQTLMLAFFFFDGRQIAASSREFRIAQVLECPDIIVSRDLKLFPKLTPRLALITTETYYSLLLCMSSKLDKRTTRTGSNFLPRINRFGHTFFCFFLNYYFPLNRNKHLIHGNSLTRELTYTAAPNYINNTIQEHRLKSPVMYIK